MDRRSLPTAGLAAIGVLALALGAATLASPVRQDDEGFGLGGGSGAEEPGIVPPPTPQSGGEGLTLPIPEEVVLVLIVIAALLTAWYLVVYVREAATTLAAAAIVIGVVVLALWALTEFAAPGAPSVGMPDGMLPGSEDGELLGEGSPTQPVVVLVLLLGMAVVGLVLVASRSSDAGEDAEEAPMGSDQAAIRALGRTAGRVADRLEDATDVDNEVYRAWREMTELLDVDDPSTTTPGEFATAATRTGMAGDDVAELTRLFEDVRYGNARPNADRETRAMAVFRRIERAYAPEE